MSYKLIWFEYGQAGCSLDTFPGSLDLCILFSHPGFPALLYHSIS
jgi:hypothetical protein